MFGTFLQENGFENGFEHKKNKKNRIVLQLVVTDSHFLWRLQVRILEFPSFYQKNNFGTRLFGTFLPENGFETGFEHKKN